MKLSVMPLEWHDDYEEYTTDNVSMTDRLAFADVEFSTFDEAVTAGRESGLTAFYVLGFWDEAGPAATVESLAEANVNLGISPLDAIYWVGTDYPEFEKLVFP